MSKEQIILAQICAPSLEWQKRYVENEHYGAYVRIADLGREIVHDVSKGKNTKLIKAFFLCLEEVLVQNEGDIAIYSLIGAGLFEAMQAAAYRSLQPPNLLERYMNEKSLRVWGDILEGWNGKGIRTIDAWRRILVSETIQKMVIELPDVHFELNPNTQNSNAIQGLPPLLFEQKIGKITDTSLSEENGFSAPFARIILFFSHSQNKKKIIIGNKISENSQTRFALYEAEIFTLHVEAYLLQFLTL